MQEVKVLDSGYLRLVETWGSDERIVEAARMSAGKGFLGWGPICANCGDLFDGPERDCPKPSGSRPYVDCGRGGHRFDAPGDEKLLRYLYENAHATPFEMAGAIVEVKAPIFVFREWHCHRTQSYNEMSARYVPLPDENYVPTVKRLLLGGGHLTKQAGTIAGAEVLDERGAQEFREALEDSYACAEMLYQRALRMGVPKELARVHLPVGRYSRMRAGANLRNWLAFLTLRAAPAAQWEIRQYANALHDVLAESFPRTLGLFDEGARR